MERHLVGIKHVIVVAQGWAATVPLEMLLTGEPEAKPDAADGTRWPWLTDRYKVSYVSSMTTLNILAREREEREGRRWVRDLFVLGDPTDRVVSGTPLWDITRTAVFFTIAGGSLLTRSVHCNVGRPSLWAGYAPINTQAASSSRVLPTTRFSRSVGSSLRE